MIDFCPENTPKTAAEWFSFLQEDWFIGILFFDFYDIINSKKFLFNRIY
ncbi:MAG: hypothetical protein BAJALOKI2v1_80084 [Promethearchaeota archaeon]|nr:MAG: hypothetical protein BAJALOKI2v1_80084 [Candidatus Lokiarchaeota archaeon]